MAEPSAPESKHKSSLNSSPWSGLMALGNSRHGPGAQCAHKAAGGAAPKPAPAGLSGGLSQPAGTDAHRQMFAWVFKPVNARMLSFIFNYF